MTALAGASLAAACGRTPSARPPGELRLVVLLVVDQLRPDLVDDYADLYTGGFRRLLDEGFRFDNATHDHAVTETAPGHTTLSTGVYPARHGIVGNTWFVRQADRWRSVYSMEDPASPIVGHPDLPGRSAANILRDGLPDWMLAKDGSARVVSISRKDRSAIGLAAQARGEVYWLAEEEPVFITSEYYRRAYPEWIVDFNRRVMPRVYSDTVWQSVVPPAERTRSRPDTSRWELDGVHTAFPHRPADTGDDATEERRTYWRFQYTPFPDRAVVELAMEAVRALDLGRRSSVDYLGVSLSQTDLVGHVFGPGSREQLDNLLRLDAELARLFEFLDQSVGEGRWVLALSADHGVLEIPEELSERGLPAVRLTRAHRERLLGRIQEGVAAAGSGDVESSIAQTVSSLDFVAAAYTFDEVERASPPDSFAVLFSHSHAPDKAVGLSDRWGVYVRFQPDMLEWNSARATHGSPYYYDRHVPLIFLGAGVQAGRSATRASTVDVAPTLARIAGIPVPADLDGRVLAEVSGR